MAVGAANSPQSPAMQRPHLGSGPRFQWAELRESYGLQRHVGGHDPGPTGQAEELELVVETRGGAAEDEEVQGKTAPITPGTPPLRSGSEGDG